MKSCKNCGCVNDNINRCCRNCGNPFDSEEITIPAAQPEPAAEEQAATEADPFVLPPVTLPEPQKDFFDLEPAAEPDTLFGMIPPEPLPEPGYIDFDLGEEPEPEPEPEEKKGTAQVLKAVASSPLFLVLALFTSCTLALHLSQVLLTFHEYYDVICDWLYIFGFDRMGAGTFSAVAVMAAVAVRLLTVAPMTLYALGLWLHYGAARKRGDGLSAGGLHLLSAGSIIDLTVASLGVVICVLSAAGLFMSRAYTEAEAQSVITGALAAVGALCLGCMASILYHSLALSTLSSLKAAAKGSGGCRISVFVMVANLLCALVYAAVAGFYLAQADILSAAMAVSEMAMLVSLTLVMVRYKLETRENA